MTEKTLRNWLLPTGQTIWYKHKGVDPVERMDEQAKQIRKLKKRLRKYGGHKADCAVFRKERARGYTCDCGWVGDG